MFAGRECGRALALMKIDVAECRLDLEGLDEKQLKTLEDWCVLSSCTGPPDSLQGVEGSASGLGGAQACIRVNGACRGTPSALFGS